MLEAKTHDHASGSAAAEEGRQAFSDFWKNAWRPSRDTGSYRITRIEGEIPRELHGTLYRNGPSQNVLPEGGAEAMHLFDGDALVHAFRFDDGRVDYTGRFVETPQFLAEKEAGRTIMPLLGSKLAPEKRSEDFPIRQQPNTNVVYHGGRLMALVENAWPFEIDARDLSPKGTVDFDGKILGMATTAHPRIDGKTGEMIIHGYGPMQPYAQYYELDADGRCKIAEPWDTPFCSMMHDMAITENYAILPCCPITIDGDRLMQLGDDGFSDVIAWEPDKGLHFGIRRRGAGQETRWFRSPVPGYMFHPGNAYEEGNKIYMDACTYEDGGLLIEALSKFRRGRGVGLQAVPYLYVFDLETGECTAKKLDDKGAEFPRLDDRLMGHKNRYGYAWQRENSATGAPLISKLVKYDRTGAPSVRHDFGAWQWPGEPVFVPRDAKAAEDDGFVLSLVYDGTTDGSYLAVLDARNMEGEPLAKAHLEHRIPLGFHGNFAPGVV